MDAQTLNMLKEGADFFNGEPIGKKIDKLLIYRDIIYEWNKKFNLTAIEDEKDFVIKHFLDSLSILPLLDEMGDNLHIIDVGTGAGFPAIPVKIVRDNLKFTLLDSVGKKVGFLNHCIEVLGLKDITPYHNRAEDLAGRNEHRESYDVAVARAVAPLPVLLEYCMPFLKNKGVFIAMKGRTVDGEIAQSKGALKEMKGKIVSIRHIKLPFSDIERNIVLIEKKGRIDRRYPRKAGVPAREPLM